MSFRCGTTVRGFSGVLKITLITATIGACGADLTKPNPAIGNYELLSVDGVVLPLFRDDGSVISGAQVVIDEHLNVSLTITGKDYFDRLAHNADRALVRLSGELNTANDSITLVPQFASGYLHGGAIEIKLSETYLGCDNCSAAHFHFAHTP